MPPRSLILIALLLVASTAAAQDDLYSMWLEYAPVKLCALDDPRVCVFVLKLNFTVDFDKTYVVWSYKRYPEAGHMYQPYYDMLTYVTVGQRLKAKIYIPSGVVYTWDRFYVNGEPSRAHTVCGWTLSHAYHIDADGYYNVDAPVPLYWLDPATCKTYEYATRVYWVWNFTEHVYLHIFYMPNATRGGNWWYETWWLDATQHRYYFYFYTYRTSHHYCDRPGYCIGGYHMNIYPMGAGFYLRPNGTRVFTTAYFTEYVWWYGPRHKDALNEATLEDVHYTTGNVVYTMSLSPSDGILYLYVPRLNITTAAELAVIQDSYIAYLVIDGPYRARLSDNSLRIYATRYTIAEVAIADDSGVYAARTVACPAYRSVSAAPSAWLTTLIALDSAREVEVCNNLTATLYVGIYQLRSRAYSYVDEVKPGACRRLRWDRRYSSAETEMRIFNSAQDFCRETPWMTVSGDKYRPGRRYYITSRGLVAGREIDHDASYVDVWKELIDVLNKYYSETYHAFLQWLSVQANATKSLQDFIASQPRYLGTVRIDSATSTWLRTVVAEFKRHLAAGPPAGGAVSVSLPAPSALAASAAAASVAVAWAASRRSLAVAAFLAGFAILATALFVAALYGATVTAALVMAAVILMSLGAAAAWLRRAED